ncbi:MAG: nucleosidase [Nocardioides sp.]
MSTLIVAATRAEAVHLPGTIASVITGIGKTAAAVGVSRYLARHPEVTEVVNIGSAGALRDGLDGIHEVGQVLNHDMSADLIRSMGYDAREWLTVGESGVLLASGDTFVADQATRARLAEVAHLVDMEGYAVAWAAEAFDVPVRLVKHVSDHADEGSMDWPSLVDVSARALAEWVSEHL